MPKLKNIVWLLLLDERPLSLFELRFFKMGNLNSTLRSPLALLSRLQQRESGYFENQRDDAIIELLKEAAPGTYFFTSKLAGGWPRCHVFVSFRFMDGKSFRLFITSVNEAAVYAYEDLLEQWPDEVHEMISAYRENFSPEIPDKLSNVMIEMKFAASKDEEGVFVRGMLLSWTQEPAPSNSTDPWTCVWMGTLLLNVATDENLASVLGHKLAAPVGWRPVIVRPTGQDAPCLINFPDHMHWTLPKVEDVVRTSMAVQVSAESSAKRN